MGLLPRQRNSLTDLLLIPWPVAGHPVHRPENRRDQRAEAETAVRRLIELAGERQTGRAAVVDWLKAEFAVEKPLQKLQDVAGLDADAFVSEVKKGRKKGLGVQDVKRLKDEFAASVVPLKVLAREADALERRCRTS